MDKVVLGFSLLCVVQWAPAAAPLSGERAGQNPSFYVHVYNYARFSDVLLTQAEEQAGQLFLRAGVTPIWVPCPCSEQEIDGYPECRNTRGLILMIHGAAGLRSDQLGAALQAAYVFPASLNQIVRTRVASWAVVLGHVAAHEMGHLLLGPGHSPDGLMRPSLRPEDWRRASVGQLGFNASERERIRSCVAKIENRPSELSSQAARTDTK